VAEEMLITKAMLGSVMEQWFQDWHDGKTISREECLSLSVEYAAELATDQVWEDLEKIKPGN
jgi:hypothetical protein